MISLLALGVGHVAFCSATLREILHHLLAHLVVLPLSGR